MKSERITEVAESKRIILEEQNAELKNKLHLTSARLEEIQSQLTNAEADISLHRNSERVLTEKLSDIDSKLALEMAQKQSLTISLRELESRMKFEIQEIKDASEVTLKQAEIRISELKSELDNSQKQLREERSNSGKLKSVPVENSPETTKLKPKPSITIPEILPSK
jgi:chromosome segregation ATPase